VANTSIILTHWGRLELNHSSNTAYGFDNYTFEFTHKTLQPDGWLHHISGHPCYTPGKVGAELLASRPAGSRQPP
jgi:hypothetical protein